MRRVVLCAVAAAVVGLGVWVAVLSGWGELSPVEVRLLNWRLRDAVHSLDVQAVKEALEAGAAANAQLDRGYTPLMFLAMSRIDYELSAMTEPGETFDPGYVSDLKRRRMEIARLLVEQGAEINAVDSRGGNAVYHAASAGDAEIAAFLLEHGADPNVRVGVYLDGPAGNTPLHWGVAVPELARVLLQYGADPLAANDWGSSPLAFAIASNRPDVVRMIEEALEARRKAEQGGDEVETAEGVTL